MRACVQRLLLLHCLNRLVDVVCRRLSDITTLSDPKGLESAPSSESRGLRGRQMKGRRRWQRSCQCAPIDGLAAFLVGRSKPSQPRSVCADRIASLTLIGFTFELPAKSLLLLQKRTVRVAPQPSPLPP